MVQLVIDNLLSSCTNRPLYEALWFLAFTRNSRPDIIENESVTAICNELIARIKQDDIDARSFLISANLAFGTVRLYKTQVDKLHDQAKMAMQTCNTTFNHMDWFEQMTQITSTPIVQSKTPKNKTFQKQNQTTTKKKSAKKVATQPAPKLLDDFDLIESIYNIIEEEDEDIAMTPVPKGRKRGRNNNDTGIGMDPTMASNVHAITMREPSTLMTSGYNTMMNEEDEDDFGDKMGDEFQSFLRETDKVVSSQENLIQTTSNLLLTVNSRKRNKTIEESAEIKKRRLSYMNNDDDSGSISVLRNVCADQQVQNIDIYQPEIPFEMDEASTFYESINATEARSNPRSMLQSSLNVEPMDIEEPSLPLASFNDPTMPSTTCIDPTMANITFNDPTMASTSFGDPTIANTTFNDPTMASTSFGDPTMPSTTFNDSAIVSTTLGDPTMPNTTYDEPSTLLNNLSLDEPATTLAQNDIIMIPDITINDVPMKETNILPQESDFILDEIPKFIKQKRVRKSRSLITDKQIILPIESIKKGIQNYKDKFMDISPFIDFERRIHYFKSCSDVLFSTGSFRLKKSTLHDLYVRNMKKIPAKLLKQQVKENDKNNNNDKELRRSSRSTKMIYNLKEQEAEKIEDEAEMFIPQLFDSKDVQMKDISSVNKYLSPEIDNNLDHNENISPDVARNARRVTRSGKYKMILKESNNIDVEMKEFDAPEIQPYFGLEKDQLMNDFELPPALDCENIQLNNLSVRNIQAEETSRKKVVLKKLVQFWKQSDKLITMDKICNGMIRSEAAGTFYELLLLAKRCVVELVHKTDSLEISNILCKISTSQLSKELYT